MAIGLLIIGDEILSGRRSDKHLPKMVQMLSERGMRLDWAQVTGDDPRRITAILRDCIASGDIVFSCGGIGATPDDHTRQCAAAALGVHLELHPFAKEKIQERALEVARERGLEVDLHSAEQLQRLKMGEFPAGAEIIPNPYNKVPGFRCGNLHFVPGFPEMAHPMIAWTLDTHYAHLHNATPWVERALLVIEVAESRLTPLMEELERDFPLIKVFSLPGLPKENLSWHIELGVKGDPAQVEAAFARICAELAQMGAQTRNL
ncbi:molybdopterin-binding protein [Massilia sp. W12]|uniref:competence/damage-inducible protein A n=1 Tax=Massilia sp. W12 TaxID=3126507 RepID=UPI0030D16519